MSTCPATTPEKIEMHREHKLTGVAPVPKPPTSARRGRVADGADAFARALGLNAETVPEDVLRRRLLDTLNKHEV